MRARQRPAQPGSGQRRASCPEFSRPSGVTLGITTHLVVSVSAVERVLQPGTWQLFRQVTDVMDMSERRGTRWPSGRPSIQGWPEPSAASRMPADLQTASR